MNVIVLIGYIVLWLMGMGWGWGCLPHAGSSPEFIIMSLPRTEYGMQFVDLGWILSWDRVVVGDGLPGVAALGFRHGNPAFMVIWFEELTWRVPSGSGVAMGRCRLQVQSHRQGRDG